VQKLEPSDTIQKKWSKFGKVIHSTNEHIKDYCTIEEGVNYHWVKQGLTNQLNKDDAIRSVEYCQSLELDIKEYELKLELNYKDHDFICEIDAVLKDNTLIEWKTAIYSEEKKRQYFEQLKLYAWMYRLKFGTFPPKVKLVFSRSQKVFVKTITEKVLAEFENQLFKTIKQIENSKKLSDYKINKESCFWCKFKKKCEFDNKRKWHSK
jgi:hypothetical protein